MCRCVVQASSGLTQYDMEDLITASGGVCECLCIVCPCLLLCGRTQMTNVLSLLPVLVTKMRSLLPSMWLCQA